MKPSRCAVIDCDEMTTRPFICDFHQELFDTANDWTAIALSRQEQLTDRIYNRRMHEVMPEIDVVLEYFDRADIMLDNYLACEGDHN
jgi:hypothetical protein